MSGCGCRKTAKCADYLRPGPCVQVPERWQSRYKEAPRSEQAMSDEWLGLFACHASYAATAAAAKNDRAAKPAAALI